MQNTNPLNWKPINNLSDIENGNNLVSDFYPYEVYWGSKMQMLNYTRREVTLINLPADINQVYLFTFQNHNDYSGEDLKTFKHCLN